MARIEGAPARFEVSLIEETDAAPAKVLVFNYFAGLKSRGIPLYARELETCFARVGAEHLEMKAPQWLNKAPQWLQNVLFVVFEQMVAPCVARWNRCDLTVYPYNSGSLWDASAGRSVMVIHDLIPNKRAQRGLAARYIRTCQAWHARLGRPVATVSRHTQRQLVRLKQFGRCPQFLWANPFYAFESALRSSAPDDIPERNRGVHAILLCSGTGANKDFRGALHLLQQLGDPAQYRIRVLGFGDNLSIAQARVDRLPADWRDRVTVLPRLSLAGIVSEFRRCDLTWVHSRSEGFGRPVMEARMCGRPVVATDIGAFRQLRRLKHVHLYRDGSFADAMLAGLADSEGECPAASAGPFNRQLEQEVARLLESAGHAGRSGVR